MKNTSEPIIVTQTFNAPIKKVWEAITVLDEMTQWYFPNIPAFEPVVGFETQFVVQVEDRIFPHVWKVKEVIPQQRIAYEWTFEGYSGKSISLFELVEKSGQTTLKLTATVVEKFPDDIPEFKRESGVEGWNYLIQENLKKYLE